MTAPRWRAIEDRIREDGPKRLLVVDPAGASLECAAGALAEIEARFVRRAADARTRLAHYFDLIAGAGLSAVLVAGLAAGLSVSEAQALSARAAASSSALDQAFGDARFGGGVLKTGLALFARPVSAEAPVTFANSPFAEDAAARDRPLRALVIASSAQTGETLVPGDAETPAERFRPAGPGGLGAGAMATLEAATLRRHGFGWATGPDRLLLVSVGAGGLASGPLADAVWRDLHTVEALAQSVKPATFAADAEFAHQLSPVPLVQFQRLEARIEAGDQRPALEQGRQAAASLFAAEEEPAVRNLEAEILPPRFDPPAFALRPPAPPKIRLEALGRVFARPYREEA